MVQADRPDAKRLWLDLWIQDPQDLNQKVISDLEQMEPFGYGNEEPVLGMGNMRILEKRIVGGNHLKLTMGYESVRFEAIGFGMKDREVILDGYPRWDIAFCLQREYWRGRCQRSLRLLDLQPSI